MNNYLRGLLGTVAAGLVCAGAPALAQRDAIFRIGMVAPSQESPAVEGLSEIRAAFARALGTPVEVMAARDYEALIAAHVDGRIDYAIYSAQAYAAAALRCDCVLPVAVPRTENGATGMRSILIARQGVEPATIALGAGDSLTARLAPLALWPDAEQAREAGKLVFTQSVEDAEGLFLSGAADAFFGWVPAAEDDEAVSGGTLARLDAAGAKAGDYEVAWRSPVLHHGPHAVRADVSQPVREKLAALLTEPSPDADGFRAYVSRHYGGGFVAASQDDYEPVLRILRALPAAR